MVRETPTISCALYSHLRFLDEPGGALVCRNHQQANSTRRVPQRERTGSGHPRIHRGAQRKSQALRLDQNGGPNPGQHRSLRPAHLRRSTILTYVTNHCDRRLEQEKTFSAELEKLQRESASSLDQEVRTLRSEKIDRDALADLFSEFALRLRD